ncbi:hypothetical protein BH20ACT1_BH20ACT1_09840 [soil metagenome]
MTIDLKPLDQQVIVVFGASSGIGRATALAAAERCAQVVEAGRDQAALDSLVEETASAPGEVVAGIAVYGPFEDITPEEFRQVIDVDLLGPVHGARAALPHLRANGGAFFVVSSEIAKRGFPWPRPTARPSTGSTASSRRCASSYSTLAPRFR